MAYNNLSIRSYLQKNYIQSEICLNTLYNDIIGKRVETENRPVHLRFAIPYVVETFLLQSEQDVICMIYFEYFDIEKIAYLKKVTIQRINQIHTRALQRLRNPMAKTILEKGELYAHAYDILTATFPESTKNDLFNEHKNQLYKAMQEGDDSQVSFLYRILNQQMIEAQQVDNSIEKLNLSSRAYNGLRMAGIRNIDDLEKITSTQLRKTKRIGQKSYEEIIQRCSEHSIKLMSENEHVI